MRLPRNLATALIMAVVSSSLWQSNVSADVFDHYKPNVLVKADRALQRGQPDRVLELLTGRIETLRHAPYRGEGYALVCKAYYQNQDFLRAEKACDDAVNATTSNWSHLNNRGVMRYLLGRYDEALSDFRQAAAVNAKSRSIRENLSAVQNVIRSQGENVSPFQAVSIR